MSYLQFVHFFCVVSYLYLAVYIVIKNHRSMLNLTCSAVILAFLHWSLSLIFVHHPGVSRETAVLFYNISSFAWGSFASIALWFIMVFIDDRKALGSKLFYVALAVPPAVVIYGQWAGYIAADYVLQPWGWAFVWSKSFWTYFFYAYYLVYMTWGLYLILRQTGRSEDPLRKRQATIVCYTAVLPLALSTTTDVVLPNLGIHVVPNMAPDFTIIWVIGLVVAIAKYRMLEITPSLAADKIISTMSDSLLLLDEEGRIAFANSAAGSLLSCRESELRGRKIDLLFPGRLREEQMSRLETGGDVVSCDCVLITRNGDEIPVIFSGSIMRGTAGEVIGTVCVARDITERKRAEEEIKTYSAQLEAVNKELESFAYSVSHDLRAPLRAIDGFSKALQEDCEGTLDETGKDHLRRVRAGAERMAQLIDDLLRLSRIARSEMKCETVDLSAMVEQIAEVLRKAEPDRKVEFAVPPGLTERGDPGLLRVALENLLGNAWKFTGRRDRARIEFGSREVADTRAFFVGDDGAGFDMAHADRLFGPFQRLHDTTEFPGTGIGLATVQRIVRRHRGRVWAEGKVRKGATFYFALWAADRGGNATRARR